MPIAKLVDLMAEAAWTGRAASALITSRGSHSHLGRPPRAAPASGTPPSTSAPLNENPVALIYR